MAKNHLHKTHDENIHQGGCACGAVRYQITAPLLNGVACHCSQCTKGTGLFFAVTQVKPTNFIFLQANALSWYRSSQEAERGFCNICGSPLFYRPVNRDHISVSLGSLDQPTYITIEKHIFTKFKPDYYEILDGKPQYEIW